MHAHMNLPNVLKQKKKAKAIADDVQTCTRVTLTSVFYRLVLD